MVITSSSYLVIWSSGHLVIWSSSQCGYLVICSICHMSSGHLVIVSSGHLVILSSGLLVIWSFPILWNPVLFLLNTWIICAHSESCFGDLIEQSGYLVCCNFFASAPPLPMDLDLQNAELGKICSGSLPSPCLVTLSLIYLPLSISQFWATFAFFDLFAGSDIGPSSSSRLQRPSLSRQR